MLAQTHVALVFTTAVLLRIATTAIAAESCTCSLPLPLPVANDKLANGYTMRGIPMSVDGPPQNIPFLTHELVARKGRLEWK